MTRHTLPPSICDDCHAGIHRPLGDIQRDTIVNADQRRVELQRRTCLCGCACQAGTVTVHPAPDYFGPPEPPPDNHTPNHPHLADDRPTQLLHLDPQRLNPTTRPPDNPEPPNPLH